MGGARYEREVTGRYWSGVSGRGHLHFDSALRRMLGRGVAVSWQAIGRRRRGGGA